DLGVHRHDVAVADDEAPARPAGVARRAIVRRLGLRPEQAHGPRRKAGCRRAFEEAPPRCEMPLRLTLIAQYAHGGSLPGRLFERANEYLLVLPLDSAKSSSRGVEPVNRYGITVVIRTVGYGDRYSVGALPCRDTMPLISLDEALTPTEQLPRSHIVRKL